MVHQPTNLSAEFVMALDEQLQKIKTNPELFAKVNEDMRKAPLRRFPYNIIYVIQEPEVVLVLAVFHQSQDPKRWMNR